MMRPGTTFVYGKAPETARALLAAAESLGVSVHAVQTVDDGFIVPDAVFDEAAPTLNPPDPDEQF